MRLDLLDTYSRLESPVHRLPAALKLAAALALVLAAILLPRTQWPGFVVIAAALAIIAVLSRVPVAFLAKRLLLLEPFVIGVAVLALFQPEGWVKFLVLLAKTNLCLLTMILLSNTTPFSEVLRVLKRLRVPAILVTTLALMYRYLFVLVEETARMRRARASRTFANRRGTAWQSLATIISQLFIRSTERAERIYAAMCARGWR